MALENTSCIGTIDNVILPLSHIVNCRRTAEQDREYHIKARRAFCKFAQLVYQAEYILATHETNHFGTERMRHHRRLLFEAAVAQAQKRLALFRQDEDALGVWMGAEHALNDLAYAIADYLDMMTLSMTTGQLVVEVDEGYDDDDLFPQERELRDNYKAALRWRKRGYNVVPQKAVDQKHPGVLWKDFQERRVTKDELLDWYSKFANGVGFITGAISGVIVIETDGLAGETVLDEFECQRGPLPATLTIRSGSQRGFHRHFKHPGYKVPTSANAEIKTDVRADGGFCVLPPSRHKSGGHYEIVHDAEPAALPEGLLEFIEAKAKGAQGNPKVGETRENRVCDGPSVLGEPPKLIRVADWTPNILPREIDKPAPPAEKMRAILEHLVAQNYFGPRFDNEKDEAGRLVKVGWIKCGMILKAAYGDEVGFELWAITHEDERARNVAPGQWKSFASEVRPGDATLGTIIKAAIDSGFKMNDSRAGELGESPPEGGSVAVGNGSGTALTNLHEDSIADIKNGRLFADMFRNKLLFVHETGEVLQFDEVSGWIHTQPGEADRAAKEVVEKLSAQAMAAWRQNHENPSVRRLMKHVGYSSTDKTLRAMIRQAQSEPGMTVRLSEFDDDSMLLGVTNGVLDLRTGTLAPVSPKTLVSKRCNVAYNPSAECPLFRKFIEEVQPDVEVRAFL